MNDRQKVLELRVTMAQQQDLIDAIENAQEIIEHENAELKAKITEQAEQIDSLNNYIDDAQGWYNEDSLKFKLAETAKKAFVSGYELCQSAQPMPAMINHNLHGFAEKYAVEISQQASK